MPIKVSATVTGIAELEARIRDIMDAAVAPQAVSVIAEAADMLYEAVKTSARSVNVPHEVISDIFSYKKQPPDLRKKGISALVGIRKRGRSHPLARGYVEWYPAKQIGKYAKGRGSKLVRPGAMSDAGKFFGLQLIGESLATMWEMGTSKMAARPFFRPAIRRVKAAVLEYIKSGYQGILSDRWNGK